jgi:hypothetical protein
VLPGISDRGAITGAVMGSDNIAHGFALSAGQLTSFNDPGAGTNNTPGSYLSGFTALGAYL